MSRLYRYKHALLSGYTLLGANILYSLASVPLALAYLTKAEFGLWALLTQLAGYVVLVDFGMSGSVSRILVDYKDNRADGGYGSTVLTFVLVGVVQGAILLVAGVSLALLGGPALRVPVELQHQFMWLVVGQSAIQAFAFCTRALPVVLTAHQRYDVTNYSQVALFALNYGLLWGGFSLGFGIYSSLWSQAIIQLLTAGINFWWSVRLKLLPSGREWGHPTWERFNEVFSFGKDVFLLALGSQMISASQAILMTPFLGVEAAGVWSVCTRAFTVVTQLVGQVLDYSAIPLSELFVRGENLRFFERFRSITVFSGSVAVVTGVLFALCNQPFVTIWTKSRFGWSPVNDALLGFWLVLVSVRRCHCGLLSIKKQLATVKYVYFAEGCVFVGLAILSMRFWGYSAVIGSSIVATAGLSFAYGLRCTKRSFQLSWKETFQWLEPAGRLAVVLVPWAVTTGLLSINLPPLARLMLTGGSTGVIGAALLLRWGLDAQMQQWLGAKLPSLLQPLLGVKGSASAL